MNTRQVSDWTHDFHFLYALKPIWLRLTDIIPTVRKIWWIVKLLWNHSWIQISIIWEFNSPLHLKINRRLTTSLFFLKIRYLPFVMRVHCKIIKNKFSQQFSYVAMCSVSPNNLNLRWKKSTDSDFMTTDEKRSSQFSLKTMISPQRIYIKQYRKPTLHTHLPWK